MVNTAPPSAFCEFINVLAAFWMKVVPRMTMPGTVEKIAPPLTLHAEDETKHTPFPLAWFPLNIVSVINT